MTTREIRRILEKHKVISERLSEVIAEIRALDGYGKGIDISQPRAANRSISSSVEMTAEKKQKLDKELGKLIGMERESYWEIQDLVDFMCRGSGKVRYDRLINDYYVMELEEAELIHKYGIDYKSKITEAISRIAQKQKKIAGGKNEAS